MYQRELTLLSVLAFAIALALTALGGWSDMLGRPFIVSKQHAWNDGMFMMLIAIFLLVLAKA
jgi:hypothetical protein